MTISGTEGTKDLHHTFTDLRSCIFLNCVPAWACQAVRRSVPKYGKDPVPHMFVSRRHRGSPRSEAGSRAAGVTLTAFRLTVTSVITALRERQFLDVEGQVFSAEQGVRQKAVGYAVGSIA